MARHAGYAIVASLQHTVINGLLAGQFATAGPFYFPLPTTVPVGGSTVSLAGVAAMAAPTVELHPNPNDDVIVHIAFFANLRSQVDAGPVTVQRVRLDTSATLRFLLGPVNGRILLRANLATVTVAPFTVTVLSGPPLAPPVVTALQSPQLAATATQIVRTMPAFLLRDLGPAQLERTQPGSFKEGQFSQFEWFTVRLIVSTTTYRVLEGAVSVGIDFAGVTQGDRSQLVDLTHSHGGGVSYTWKIGSEYDPNSRPVLVGQSHKLPNVALLVNIAVLTNVTLGQITPQIDGTPMTKEVQLRRVIGEYSHFEKPLRGWEDALLLRALATSHGVAMEAFIYLQPTIRFYDGPSSDAQKRYPPTWLMMVGYVEVPTPWWLDAAMMFLRFLSIVLVDALLSVVELVVPLATSQVDKWIEGVHTAFTQSDPDNIAGNARKSLEGSFGDVGLPASATFISMTPDGIDMGFGVSGDFPPQLPKETWFDAAISPTACSVYYRKPIVTQVRLDPKADGLRREALMANWVVRRKDTNQVIVTGAKPYNNGVDNGVSIPHHSDALYRVGEYTVQCTLTLSLGSQVADIWSGMVDLVILDELDYWASGSYELGMFRPGAVLVPGKGRQLPFVEWGPRIVRFPSAWLRRQLGPDADAILRGASNDQIAAYVAAADAAGEDFFWQRISRSRIHRTAVAARCKMLRQVGDTHRSLPFFGLRFREYLPFTWDNIAAHRKELCDYCFWGGPDKTAPFPAYDWYEPDELIKPSGFEKHHFG